MSFQSGSLDLVMSGSESPKTKAARRAARPSAPPPDPCSKLELFPIPVFRWHWDEAGAAKEPILAAIRTRRLAEPGLTRSNRQGWHSAQDLPAWSESAVRDLVRWCAECTAESTLLHQGARQPAPARRWRLSAWANVNPPGGAHNVSHTHARKNWHWSACYYVHLPDLAGDSRGGALVFEDRGSGLVARDLNGPGREHRLIPREGELIIFPSWLYHRVEEHAGSGERVTIAFNLYNPALERARLWKRRPRWWWRKFPALMRPIARARSLPDETVEAPNGWDVDLPTN